METLTYIWSRLPFVLMFASGYLVYRMLAATCLADFFMRWGMRKCEGFYQLLFYIMLTACLLSFFIPNAVTILIMLPVLKTIESEAIESNGHSPATPLTLAAIYGANIGGMGSLIGSPANLLLIGALDMFDVPGREGIGFLNWFFWSVPLVIILVAAAWIMLLILAAAEKKKTVLTRQSESRQFDPLSLKQKKGIRLFFFFLAFWSLASVANELIPGFDEFEALAGTCFFLVFVYLMFFRPAGTDGRPFLHPKDLIRGVPRRGILFLLFLVLIIFVAGALRIDRMLPEAVSGLAGEGLSFGTVLLITTMSAVFLTEILGNSVVAAAFFPVAYHASTACGAQPIILMIAVSVSSTCAFMTPVATPCNALAFGEMKRTSLPRMMIAGFFLNVAGASLAAAWLQFAIPVVYL